MLKIGYKVVEILKSIKSVNNYYFGFTCPRVHYDCKEMYSLRDSRQVAMRQNCRCPLDYNVRMTNSYLMSEDRCPRYRKLIVVGDASDTGRYESRTQYML